MDLANVAINNHAPPGTIATPHLIAGDRVLIDSIANPVATPYTITPAATVTILKAWGPEMRLVASQNITLTAEAALLDASTVSMFAIAINPNGFEVAVDTAISGWAGIVADPSWAAADYNDIVFRKRYGSTVLEARK